MLKVFSIGVYSLLNPGATLSFFIDFVAIKFEKIPKVLVDPFLVYPD